MGINLFYSCILLSTLILHLRACITGDNYMDAFGCTITGKDCDDGYEFTKCKQRVCKQYDYSQYEEDCYSAEIFDLGEDECAQKCCGDVGVLYEGSMTIQFLNQCTIQNNRLENEGLIIGLSVGGGLIIILSIVLVCIKMRNKN